MKYYIYFLLFNKILLIIILFNILGHNLIFFFIICLKKTTASSANTHGLEWTKETQITEDPLLYIAQNKQWVLTIFSFRLYSYLRFVLNQSRCSFLHTLSHDG
jgi:hypothetical protein